VLYQVSIPLPLPLENYVVTERKRRLIIMTLSYRHAFNPYAEVLQLLWSLSHQIIGIVTFKVRMNMLNKTYPNPRLLQTTPATV